MRFVVLSLALLMAGQSLGEEAPPSRSGWELVWHDEFDGPALDLTKWAYRQLGLRESALISEDAVSLDGAGHLLLTVKEQDGKMINGMIGTQRKFTATYGLFEARVQFPRMQGQHGSFWMQPDKPDRSALDDPAHSGAEIDIIEFFGVGRKDGGTASNIYWPGKGSAKKNHAGGTQDFHRLLKKDEEWSDDYHVYAVEWSPQEYVLTIDGHETYRIKEGVSQIPQYMILSLLTADWELTRLDKTKLPDAMKVDWVRVWKKDPP